MNAQSAAKNGVSQETAAKGYVSLPAEESLPADRLFTVPFVIFAVLVIGLATGAGLVQSGRVSLNQYFSAKPVAQSQGPLPFNLSFPGAHPVATPAVPPPSPGTFVVTSISIGQQSFAIINGTSHSVGDAVAAPGAAGWSVRQITEDGVVLQNGATLATIPLSTPGLKPLNDNLKPLN